MNVHILLKKNVWRRSVIRINLLIAKNLLYLNYHQNFDVMPKLRQRKVWYHHKAGESPFYSTSTFASSPNLNCSVLISHCFPYLHKRKQSLRDIPVNPITKSLNIWVVMCSIWYKPIIILKKRKPWMWSLWKLTLQSKKMTKKILNADWNFKLFWGFICLKTLHQC